MRSVQRVGALVVVCAVAGCASPRIGAGNAASHSTATPSPSAAASGPASPVGLHPPSMPIHPNLDMSQPVNDAAACDWIANPPSLAEEVRDSGPGRDFRAAAIVTVVAALDPVWNTPDGHRWTQAEVQADTTVDPAVYTPYRLRIQRLLSPANGLQQDEVITAYQLGGVTRQGDHFYGCGGASPQPGWSAVVLLGHEVDTDAGGTAAIRKPVIDELDVIAQGAAQTRTGPQPIP